MASLCIKDSLSYDPGLYFDNTILYHHWYVYFDNTILYHHWYVCGMYINSNIP